MAKNYHITIICILSLFTGLAIAHEWMAPKEFSQRKNPVEPTLESRIRGKKLFSDSCSVCHGEEGDGMSAGDAGLKKSPPNLKKRLRSHSDGDFFWKIQTGKGEMPGFKEDLTEQEIWEIINFIKSDAPK